MNTIVRLCICSIVCGFSVSASAQKQIKSRPFDVALPTAANHVSRQYGNLDYGIRIQVKNGIDEYNLVDVSELPSKDAASVPGIKLENSVAESIEQYLDNMASGLGFRVGTDINTDYILNVTVKDFKLRIRDYNVKNNVYASSAAMVVNWELLNENREVVISSVTSTGRGTARNLPSIASPLTISYTQALNGIDWNRIAAQLQIAKTAKQEKNKQVSGKGDTALESTVIRWYVVSTPLGADVSWRVVSSTPDVANTNANFVGTTPYETTETFDIKGLTYNNSGNVQIEVTCERAGYMPQKKRFNLRQVIDQKEISTKFNLVKEDE